MSALGRHRHRQPWQRAVCPVCGVDVQVRRTTRDKPLHVRAHFDPDGRLCPYTQLHEEDHLP